MLYIKKKGSNIIWGFRASFQTWHLWWTWMNEWIKAVQREREEWYIPGKEKSLSNARRCETTDMWEMWCFPEFVGSSLELSHHKVRSKIFWRWGRRVGRGQTKLVTLYHTTMKMPSMHNGTWLNLSLARLTWLLIGGWTYNMQCSKQGEQLEGCGHCPSGRN